MAVRGGDGEDKDDALYDCSTCCGEERVARRCDRPTLELVEYQQYVAHRKITDEVTGATAADRCRQATRALGSGVTDGTLRGLLQRVGKIEDDRKNSEIFDIRAGLGGYGPDSKSEELCPVLTTSPRSYQWLTAYRRASVYAGDMGGLASWTGGGIGSEDCRRLDAFDVIRSAISEGRDGR